MGKSKKRHRSGLGLDKDVELGIVTYFDFSLRKGYAGNMIQDYLMHHINKARYEIIDGGKRYYGEIPGLKGVWATGNTLEECRRDLLSTLEGWLIIRLQKNLSVPGFKFTAQKTGMARAYHHA